MKLDQAQSALAHQQDQFQAIVKLPNTLERNLILAGHRTEILRLQKLIAKSSRQPATN